MTMKQKVWKRHIRLIINVQNASLKCSWAAFLDAPIKWKNAFPVRVCFFDAHEFKKLQGSKGFQSLRRDSSVNLNKDSSKKHTFIFVC